MDLRTKLVFILVAVALASMLALGSLAYTNAAELITQRSVRGIVSLAEAKADRIESVEGTWREAVGLLASRTQLRRSLASWNESTAQADREDVLRIISDARATSDLVEAITIYDADGTVVAFVGPGERAPRARPGAGTEPGTEPRLLGFSADPSLGVAYWSRLVDDTTAVGDLWTLLSAHDLLDVADNWTGLRETGETLIAVDRPDGGFRLVTPLRHTSGSSDSAVAAAERLMSEASDRTEDPITQHLVDYRGEPVWAAFRRIDAAGLSLLVKIDESEERADVVEFRDRIVGVGFSVAAFAILAGVAMAFSFARPINQLAEVARRIHDGDLEARADADREDELGLLAETFNEMSEELQRRMTVLEEFRTFFDESRDMQCIAGTNGYFKRVNPAFVETLGWSEEELLSRPFIEFVHPDDVEATAEETVSVSGGRPTISFSNRYRCRDGTYKRLRWTAHPDPATGNIYASARSPDQAEDG